MKSYNRATSKVRRPEASYESGENFGKKIKKEVKSQVKLAGEDFFSQLLQFNESYADEMANDNKPAIFKSETVKSKEKSKPSKKGVIFDIASQLISEKSILLRSEIPSGERISRSKKEAGIDYRSEILRSGERMSGREKTEHNKRIEQLMGELKKLASSMKDLQREFGQVSVDQAPVNPGTYYVNFFEWMLIMIKQARQKVEDSKAWLDTLKGKSKKKGYWGMAKKQGTSFTQNNERNVATSTG